MIQSMTGYAAASAESPHGALAIELRSVNSRFLDLQFRVAEELRAAEPMLREQIAARIARGKIDCRLSIGQPAQPAAPRLNAPVLERLKAMEREVTRVFPAAAALASPSCCAGRACSPNPRSDEEAARTILEALCRRTLDELCAARGREGAKLAAILLGRVAEMRKRLAEVAPLVPEAVAAHRARLAERLREVLDAGVEERIRTEVALFAAKTDVDEEITRLATHLDEVERVLAQGGAAGKRLDFLAQELNREANTLASKAAGLRIADCALELKLLIEQIREQVQNIE